MSEVEGQKAPEAEEQGMTKEVESTEKEVDYKSLVEELESIKASKDRILQESKDYKAKYKELAAEKEEREKIELEKKGEYEKLLKKERESRIERERQLEDMRVKTVESNTRIMVQDLARNAYDIDDVLSVGNPSLLELEEETLRPTAQSVEEFVNDVRKRKPHLFSKSLPKNQDTYPKGEVPIKKTNPEDVFKAFLSAVKK